MRKRVQSAAATVSAIVLLTQAEAASFSRITAAGQPVRIASHATWNSTCVGGPALVEVVEAPQHGRLLGRSERTVIRRIGTGSSECLGHKITAKAVFYRPDPGFTGSDGAYYTSTTSKGVVLTHAASIEVR